MDALSFLESSPKVSADDFLAGKGMSADEFLSGKSFKDKVVDFIGQGDRTPTVDYIGKVKNLATQAYESKPVQDALTAAQATAEIPIAAVTGVGGFFAGKAAGLAQSLLGRNRDVSLETEGKVAGAISYQPQTEVARRTVEALFAPFTALAGLGKESAMLVAESQGIPKSASYPIETAGELTAFAGLPAVKRTTTGPVNREGKSRVSAERGICREGNGQS
jgi:hypothetical protein